jgi:phosphorylcholine metabolism protein LicD
MENYILSDDDSFNLYKILHEVVKIFEKNNIVYWATCGTFLGAIRCKGIRFMCTIPGQRKIKTNN